MQDYDAQKAARVWARVHTHTDPAAAAPAAREPELPCLAQGELALGKALEGLAQKGMPRQAQRLRELAQGCRQRADALRGLCALSELPANSRGTPAVLSLADCCRHSLALLEQYRLLAERPPYGPLMAALHRQLLSCCLALAQLLGQNK